MKLEELVKEFLDILETKEKSDSGKEFHPTAIRSCRHMAIKRIGEIIVEMKRIINYDENGS